MHVRALTGRLGAGFSPRRPTFDPSLVRRGSIVNRMVLGQVFRPVHRFLL